MTKSLPTDVGLYFAIDKMDVDQLNMWVCEVRRGLHGELVYDSENETRQPLKLLAAKGLWWIGPIEFHVAGSGEQN